MRNGRVILGRVTALLSSPEDFGASELDAESFQRQAELMFWESLLQTKAFEAFRYLLASNLL